MVKLEMFVTKQYWQGCWRLADPKISLASGASMFLAAAMAADAQPLHWGWLVLTVLGIFAVEVAKNASGDIFDYRSGADLAVAPEHRNPFSGGKRVLVDGVLSEAQTWQLARVFYGIAIACGLVIVIYRNWRVLPLALLGLALAWFYHAEPLKLSYRGYGEIAVALCYGPLIACGTYLVQTGELTADLFLTSMALGLMVAGFLWINEFPDYLGDKACGKRNLVVQMGISRAKYAFALLLLGALMLLPLVALRFPEAGGVLWGLVAAPPALFAAYCLIREPEDPAKLIPAQAATLLAMLALAVGAGLGYLWA
jgi:1,4-dihydroxy-2-naphthoate octaprenyltransferase